MGKRKKLFFLVSSLLAITVCDLSETIVAEATTGQITVNGRIGEATSREEIADNDKKQTIVADVSQIGQRKLPQAGSSTLYSLIILGYVFVVLFLVALIRKKKHVEKNRSLNLLSVMRFIRERFCG